MELPHIHLLPSWLQRTAERAQSRAQASLSDHISVRHETCRVETQDGFRVLKCEEIKEVFRLAHDGYAALGGFWTAGNIVRFHAFPPASAAQAICCLLQAEGDSREDRKYKHQAI